MEEVAAHLANEARVRHLAGDKKSGDDDSFGRSAFNRYYYATFLVIREGLRSLHGTWAGLAHKDIPPLLKGEIKKTLKRGLQDAKRLSDGDVVKQCSKAIEAADELAELTTRAYGVRVTADYNPEIRVSFNERGTFSLNAIAVDEAKKWPYKARALVPAIISAWSQI